MHVSHLLIIGKNIIRVTGHFIVSILNANYIKHTFLLTSRASRQFSRFNQDFIYFLNYISNLSTVDSLEI